MYALTPSDVQPDTKLADILGRTEGGRGADLPPPGHRPDRARGLVPSRGHRTAPLEALEDPDLPFCLAVQWHPEVGDDLSVFTALAAAARIGAAVACVSERSERTISTARREAPTERSEGAR